MKKKTNTLRNDDKDSGNPEDSLEFLTKKFDCMRKLLMEEKKKKGNFFI